MSSMPSMQSIPLMPSMPSMISDPSQLADPAGPSGPAGDRQRPPQPGEEQDRGWLEGWADSWVEDEPEPVAAPRPVAPTVPLVGGGTAVPPTRRVALFAPIRAGGGRHRLAASARRRPGPIMAGLMVAVTTLAVGALCSPEPPSHGHAAFGVPVHAHSGGAPHAGPV